MKRAVLPLALVGLLLLSSQALAQVPGTVTISSVGPGTNAGELKVAGTFTTNPPWAASQLSLIIFPVNGGPITLPTVPNLTTPWSVTVPGLNAGAQYTVIAKLVLVSGAQTQPVFSDPKNGNAK